MKAFLRRTFFYRLYKRFIAWLALLVYWNPWKGMFIVWVTGTDWKSTTSNLLHKILNDNLWKTALVTTISIKVWDEDIFNNSKMTSLSPFALQKMLSYAKSKGCKYAVLEVSSHWIDQYRFEWVEFDMWILTNITPEHLDYHWSFENYVDTKKKLFTWILKNTKDEKLAVLPKDDKNWRNWYEEIWFDRAVDYSILTNAAIKWDQIELSANSTNFVFNYLWKAYNVSLPLIWKFNVYNALAAMSAWILAWISIENIIKSIEWFQPLPWRMDYVQKDWKRFFIDFAHTPNSLESVLDFLNEIKWNWKIITVFWAPWNRDKFKRPEMWKIVSRKSDIIIVTDDDPDTECRLKIIDDISRWIERKLWEDYYILPDRANAIRFANKVSKPWDTILLAWKWHEKIQLTNFWKINWNDKDFVMNDFVDENDKNEI